ncbi:uncharacterized protein PV07_02202 [Cladophialophora immunda]|uniref:Uncharacterized protein n=1 Tax=Cladophialophora immunda TaxID=569365 RepID=A0A0D2A5C0_9EURO|nr:uncharacterized protein PV07_02202 [Cladophialophora immunda]KIW35511.1 hypothetical protein PV07_02202 [Cladophialophora immunda]OQV08535.1 hypothetical protein CLAIMM_12791 [Cladophialophora immunda]
MSTEAITISPTYQSRLARGAMNGNTFRHDVHPCGSIPKEAKQILVRHLLENPSLDIPSQVSRNVSAVTFTPEAGPFMPTPMKMSESVSALWACIGLFASAISQERYSVPVPKSIQVDVHSATLMLMSLALFEIEGCGQGEAAQRVEYIDKGRISETYRAMATNIYKTANGRYFQLHGSLDTTPVLHMLGLAQNRPDLEGAQFRDKAKQVYRAAVAERDSAALEIEVNERWRQPGVTCLTLQEYTETPHGRSNIKEPLYTIDAVHESLPPVAWPNQESPRGPLAGIKVLDLTKVIAGPTITRILALLGADVLRISTDTKPDAGFALYDGQLGKRDANLDLKTVQGKASFTALLEDADVIVDGYRPGVLEKLGFSGAWMQELARRRGKGIVYCRENCYGWNGEWSGRAGYQQISDCVTGAAWEQGKFLELDEPVVPLLPNSDYQTGLVGGIAVMQALMKRATSGGSYNVFVSLNQFNNWYLRSVGLQGEETQAAIRALYPEFLPRHDMDIFELISRTLEATRTANGDGKGQLFDPARFTTGSIRWGKEGEVAQYLDWRRIVVVKTDGADDGVVFGFENGSCMPGSDQPRWH